MFRSITDYDGMTMGERSSSVTSNTSASIDNLTVRTLAVSAYYDFPAASGRFAPYVGAGLGPAFVDVVALHFSNEYQVPAGDARAYDPPVSFYDSRQDADLADTVLAGHLHAGADHRVGGRTLLGAKLTWSMLGPVEAQSGYSLHPFHAQDPDFPNHNRFTGTRFWTLMFTVKRLFGN